MSPVGADGASRCGRFRSAEWYVLREADLAEGSSASAVHRLGYASFAMPTASLRTHHSALLWRLRSASGLAYAPAADIR
jgi:hypothetical protein